MSYKKSGQEKANELSTEFKANGSWRHYKGGLYTIICLAVKEDTGRVLVIYKSVLYGSIWAREVSNWKETVFVDAKTIPRFIEVT